MLLFSPLEKGYGRFFNFLLYLPRNVWPNLVETDPEKLEYKLKMWEKNADRQTTGNQRSSNYDFLCCLKLAFD